MHQTFLVAAQTIVTIGTQQDGHGYINETTHTGSAYFPLYNHLRFNRSQSLYIAEDLNVGAVEGPKNITAVGIDIFRMS